MFRHPYGIEEIVVCGIGLRHTAFDEVHSQCIQSGDYLLLVTDGEGHTFGLRTIAECCIEDQDPLVHTNSFLLLGLHYRDEVAEDGRCGLLPSCTASGYRDGAGEIGVYQCGVEGSGDTERVTLGDEPGGHLQFVLRDLSYESYNEVDEDYDAEEES